MVQTLVLNIYFNFGIFVPIINKWGLTDYRNEVLFCNYYLVMSQSRVNKLIEDEYGKRINNLSTDWADGQVILLLTNR